MFLSTATLDLVASSGRVQQNPAPVKSAAGALLGSCRLLSMVGCFPALVSRRTFRS
jgi:hypothetical protein